MANTGLRGPWSLTHEEIDRVVERVGPGAYALGTANDRGLLAVRRIGRSDKDLNDRLHDYVDKYDDFKCDFLPNAKAAYEKECNLWHDFKPQDNPNHPDKPDGTDYPCPDPDCPK